MNYFLPFAILFCAACAPAPEALPEEEAFECVEANTLCSSLTIPNNYDGTPRELFIGFYASDNFNRPPDAQINPVASPTIVSGETYEFSRENLDIVGDYYLYFVLYDLDGGEFIPKSGIDYIATTTEVYTFDGNPITLPTLDLTIAE